MDNTLPLMESSDILIDAFTRIRQTVHRATTGLSAEQLAYRPDRDANSIAWLIWHLTRIQDDHVADLAGQDQAWAADGWADRFGLPFDGGDTGFGHSSAQVAAVSPDGPDILLGYHDAVSSRAVEYLKRVDSATLDRIIDTSWDPPVSVGVRLVSVINDNTQHAGQAAYVRGIAERRGPR